MKRKPVSVDELRGQVSKALRALYKVIIVGQKQGIISQADVRPVNDLVTAIDLAFQPLLPIVIRRTSTAELVLFCDEDVR